MSLLCTPKLWWFAHPNKDEFIELAAYSRMEAWQEFQDMGYRDTSGWTIEVRRWDSVTPAYGGTDETGQQFKREKRYGRR